VARVGSPVREYAESPTRKRTRPTSSRPCQPEAEHCRCEGPLGSMGNGAFASIAVAVVIGQAADPSRSRWALHSSPSACKFRF
jgi:hypothetical protein